VPGDQLPPLAGNDGTSDPLPGGADRVAVASPAAGAPEDEEPEGEAGPGTAVEAGEPQPISNAAATDTEMTVPSENGGARRPLTCR
jgi:hypothetical protein